ncbi:MAG: hypothetical protein WAL37_15990, partial [Xanthobacteraceae bacterium]
MPVQRAAAATPRLHEHHSDEWNELQPDHYHHEAGYCERRHCAADHHYSTIIHDDYELRHYD